LIQEAPMLNSEDQFSPEFQVVPCDKVTTKIPPNHTDPL
jgi:hypothetical protein